MDTSQLDQVDKSSPETFSDSSLPSDSPVPNSIFGEPLIHPRVGDEYQVEIPSLRDKSELLQLMMNPAESKGLIDSSRSLGLPFPVIWIRNEENVIKEHTEALNVPHAICPNGLVESGNNVGMSNVSSAKEEPNVKVDIRDQTYCLVPGESSAPWSEFEADCFLLGLYMFGKNLLQVMRFMESKRIGEILAYYYGRFYGSSGYRKWSECRKMRNRKCVPGHRFFTGYRQHELFARLVPSLSEESKTKFMEVSKAFAEGRTYLEEYVSSLKALVGIHALVEAVGIGKGKDDLTTIVLDGTRNNQLFTHRPEVPSGKAFSSLTCAEIVNFLTGDFRLSKARSNDLFWEAVWPRLLARGWHSEQPSGDNYVGSKNSLVFLMPGIKNFSRKKLSKGEHYFDSVSDLLAKVSSEPQLLELEADESTPSTSKVENGWALDVKLDDDRDLSDHERHCYLKPRVSAEILNPFKFTVVDTSLADEDNPSKVRELRSLPLAPKRCLSFKKANRSEIHVDTKQNGLQMSTTLPRSKGFTGADGASGGVSGSLKKAGDDSLLKDQRPRTIKLKFSRRSNPILTSCCSSDQVTKKRKIASCVGTGVRWVLGLPAKAMMTYEVETENKSTNVTASKAMMTYYNALPSRVTHSDDAKAIFTRTLVLKTLLDKSLIDTSSFVSGEKENLSPEPNVINLNVPQVEPESDGVKLEIEPESDGSVKLEGKIETEGKVKLEGGEDRFFEQPESRKSEHSDANDHLVSCATVEPTNKDGDTLNQQQPTRKSTRNRPLTTKALEALEIGFLTPVKNSRKRPPSTLKEQKSKCSGQMCKKSSISPPSDENCNAKMSEISVDKEAMTPDLLGLAETSFAPTTSSKKMLT